MSPFFLLGIGGDVNGPPTVGFSGLLAFWVGGASAATAPVPPAPLAQQYGGRHHTQGDLNRASRELAAARKRWQLAERAAEKALEARKAEIAGIVARKGAPKPAKPAPARIAAPEPKKAAKPVVDNRLAIAKAEMEAAQATYEHIKLDMAARAAEAEETLMIAVLLFG